MDIKLLSKALIARLIPVDTTDDDNAALLLINDDEARYLVNVLQSCQYTALPINSVLTDLCRSRHNMQALVTMDVASVLSDYMDSISESDQICTSQLIRSMMTLNCGGSEKATAVTNNGTLFNQSFDEEGMCFHVG